MSLERSKSPVDTIAVFSDTHLHDLAVGVPYLEAIMHRWAPRASLVLHAGDIGDPDLAYAFAGREFVRVQGNTDHAEPGVPIRTLMRRGDYRIGLVHGWGGRREIETHVRREFADDQPDLIIYGHSHWPVCRREGKTLLFNPGSCVDKRSAKHFTFGLIELGATISARIVIVDDLAKQYLHR